MTTTGARARAAARAWSCSGARRDHGRARPIPSGYQTASRASVATRPAPAERKPPQLEPGASAQRAQQAAHWRAVPARVCTSGVDVDADLHARLLVGTQHDLTCRTPGEPRGVLEPGGDELARARRPPRAIPAAIAAGSSGSTRTAAVPHASSIEGCDRDDDGRSARHRLDDRHPEALEERGVDGDRGAAVEPGELLVGDEAERRTRGSSSPGCSPQPSPPATASASSSVEQAGGLDESSAGSCAARASPTASTYGRRGLRRSPSAGAHGSTPGGATRAAPRRRRASRHLVAP